MMKLKFLLLSALAALLLLRPAYGEQMAQLGPWDVHYIVVDTTFLTPEVARNYGIVRSKYNALVNITVLNSDTQQAQNVSVSGKATNLIGNTRNLAFKKVEEGESIYYLAVLPFRDRETFRFAIDVRHGNDVKTLKFKQELFTED
tara:strand:+ start:257 stop:691 length:435 start_codon:yes stop_codon:yes gene_type:complete